MKHIAPGAFALANPLAARPRAVTGFGVRADVSDPKVILAEIQKAVTEMRAEHEAELKALRKDIVQTEKVDRINAQITDLTKALDEINAQIGALKLGGNGSAGENSDRKAHAAAFDKWFRKGVDAGLRDLEVKASMSTQSDPDGGYLVPDEMASTIDRVLSANSVMRQLATVMPIGTSTYKKLVSVGGATSGWVGEEEARPETATPQLRELLFNVMEMYAKPATTQTMLDDGIVDIAGWLAGEVQTTFDEQEGAAFISGNGVKRPRGLLAYSTVANSSYAWGSLGFVNSGATADFAATAPGDALIDLLFALKAGYRQNASFLMSDVVMGRVRKFKDGQGNYLWAPPTTVEQVPTILGKPVYTDDNMPNVGANAFPVACGDFKRGYMILDRQGIRILRDPYTSMPNVFFYTTKRVGGGVANFEAIKLLRCST
jgi:HK97 family phage major capsid protein